MRERHTGQERRHGGQERRHGGLGDATRDVPEGAARGA